MSVQNANYQATSYHPMNILHALTIQGWMSINELRWLAKTAQNSLFIVETGSYLGRSTRALADNTRGVVLSFDPYCGDYCYDNGEVFKQFSDKDYEAFKANVADLLTNRRLVHHRMPLDISRVAVRPDLVFLDGDHRYESLKKEINEALKLTPKILAGHDYAHKDWPGVKQAVDEILGPVQLVDTIWIKRF